MSITATIPARFEVMDSKAAQLPQFLKATEVAALLRINRNTVYEAVQRDEIPGVVRVGRVLRFRRDAIIAWLEDQ